MGYEVQLEGAESIDASWAREALTAKDGFVFDSEDEIRGRLSPDGTPVWFERGRICVSSPTTNTLRWLLDLAAMINGRVVGEDGVEIADVGVLAEVQQLIRSMNEDPAPVTLGVAQWLSDLTDPFVSADRDEELLAQVRSLAAPVRRPAAAYLISRAVECGGDPEDRVVTAMALLSDVAANWLADESAPLEEFCPEVRRRAQQLHGPDGTLE